MPPHNERSVQINQQSRDQGTRDAIQIVSTSDHISGTKKKDDSFLLQSGEHGGASITSKNTVVGGLPGSTMTKKIIVSESCCITGVRFVSRSDEVLVDITNKNCTVTFIGCQFEKYPSTDPTFIKVEDGAKVHLIGCSFFPLVSVAGSIINGSTVSSNIQLFSCSNTTGQTLGTCTDTGTTA